jgi:hypothetical protein
MQILQPVSCPRRKGDLKKKKDKVVHICNPSTSEAEAGGSQAA